VEASEVFKLTLLSFHAVQSTLVLLGSQDPVGA
jgi:hypothetical protein